MFSEIPGYAFIQTPAPLSSVIRPTELLRSVVSDASYRSLGRQRQSETHCILHYTCRGSGFVDFRGKRFFTQPGEGFLNIISDPESGYGYPADAREPWEFVVICFDGGNVREVFSELLNRQVIYKIPPAEVHRLCTDLLSQRLNAGSAALIFSRLLSLLHQDIRNPLCESFMQLAKETLHINPTIAALAMQLNVSREHLQRTFTQHTGMTCATYLSRLRLEELCRLLSHTQDSEASIAEQMRFGSPSCMIAFFKRMTGITPGQFRKIGFFPT